MTVAESLLRTPSARLPRRDFAIFWSHLQVGSHEVMSYPSPYAKWDAEVAHERHGRSEHMIEGTRWFCTGDACLRYSYFRSIMRAGVWVAVPIELAWVSAKQVAVPKSALIAITSV